MLTNWDTSKQAEMYPSIMCERRGCLVGGLFLWDNRGQGGGANGVTHTHLCIIFMVKVFFGV